MTLTADERLELLLCLRVWVAGEKGIEHRALVESLRPWLEGRLTGPEIGEAVGARVAVLAARRELAAAGPRAYRLGGAGVERIRLVCGYSQRPRGWVQAQGGPLVVLALGVEGASADERRRLASADGLRAEVLRRAHGLDVPRAPSLAVARNALLRSAVGAAFGAVPAGRAKDPFGTGAVIRFVLSRLAGAEQEVKPEKALALLAARAVGARKPGAGDLRRAVVDLWLAGGSIEEGGAGPSHSAHGQVSDPAIGRVPGAASATVAPETRPVPPAPEATRTIQPPGPDTARSTSSAEGSPARQSPTSIEALEPFAITVLEAGSAVREGRFGPRRVFLDALWHEWSASPGRGGIPREEFERALLAAHAAGHLTLSRADLVEAMDPELVARSALRGRASTFHFLKLPLVLR